MQFQKLKGSGMDVRSQFGDFITQAFQVTSMIEVGVVARGGQGMGVFHRHSPEFKKL
jgi:hypothetical protein